VKRHARECHVELLAVLKPKPENLAPRAKHQARLVTVGFVELGGAKEKQGQKKCGEKNEGH